MQIFWNYAWDSILRDEDAEIQKNTLEVNTPQSALQTIKLLLKLSK